VLGRICQCRRPSAASRVRTQSLGGPCIAFIFDAVGDAGIAGDGVFARTQTRDDDALPGFLDSVAHQHHRGAQFVIDVAGALSSGVHGLSRRPESATDSVAFSLVLV
jgi:hypothetical protein